jgi:hypothetical protein
MLQLYCNWGVEMRTGFLLALLIIAGGAQATAVYSYTGNPYTTISNSGIDLYTGESIPHPEPYDSGMHLSVELVFENELTRGDFALKYDSGYSGEMYNTDNKLLSISFSDGIDTFTTDLAYIDLSYDPIYFQLSVNDSGEIEFWSLMLSHDGPYNNYNWFMSTGFGPETRPFNMNSPVLIGDHTSLWEDGPGRSSETQWGGDLNVPQGTWSSSVVPIPAAVWLFGSALACMGWLRRKQTAKF